MSFGYEELLGGPCTGIRQSSTRSLASIGSKIKKTARPQCQQLLGAPLWLSPRNAKALAQHYIVQEAKSLPGEQHAASHLCWTEYI